MVERDIETFVEAFFDERPSPARSLVPSASAVDRPFSAFSEADAGRAQSLFRDLRMAADAAGGGADGFAAASVLATDQAAEHGIATARFVMKLFITHHPSGRFARIPALEQRAPQRVVPTPADGDKAGEAVLDWYREDAEANEHHDHWHVVYPFRGLAEPTREFPDRRRVQDRQGELFLYMHQQMLARYDHERLGVGLAPVRPLDDYSEPIIEGYDPAAGLAGLGPRWTDGVVPSARPSGVPMASELDGVTRDQLASWALALREDIQQDHLAVVDGHRRTTPDLLGHAVEPSWANDPAAGGPTAVDRARYGSLHNAGHRLIAAAAGPGKVAGVMADTDTAIRDPVFYRWHRHVDDFSYAAQERRDPHDLRDHAGRVRMRRAGDGPSGGRPPESQDLILFAELPEEDDGEAVRRRAEDEAGGDNWDVPAGDGELLTEMLERPLCIREEDGTERTTGVTLRYLDQRPFGYGVRLEHTGGGPIDVTVRLFMVADAFFTERRMWIELDKFRHRADGGRSVAARHASESAVIRKPASKPPSALRHARSTGGAWDDDAYCACGWPYNLLIPRGTRDGMACWLAAVVTDWGADATEVSECGSMSFCGTRQRYPDRRPMGYPFDRPFGRGGIPQAMSEHDHIAARRFVIRWANATS